MLREGFHTFTNGVLFSSPTQPTWDITIHPQGFHGDLFSSQPIWDITIHLLQAQRSHQHSFIPPINMGPLPNSPPLKPASLLAYRLVSTPFGEQRKGQHIVRCLALIPFVIGQIHQQEILSPSSFPSRLQNASARERFPHLYNFVFVLLSNQCGT